MSDSLICTSAAVNFERKSGRQAPLFGASEWTFEGGVPSSATGATVENVRFGQPGSHGIRHIFTVAGCQDTAFTMIDVMPPPLVNLGADTALCVGEMLQLFAGMHTSATYLWNTGETGASIPVQSPGFFTVTVTQSSGCSATDGMEVLFLNAESVYLGPDTILCPDATIRLYAPETAAGQSLTWSTGAGGNSLEVSSPGLYALQLNTAQCSFSDTILVRASDCNECKVYAPNVFAPESSATGHLFQLFPGCPFLAGRWRIYDRWGSLLFESDNLNSGWNGRLNGKAVPPGVYLYDAEIQLAPLQMPVEWRKVSGSVVLVR
jgi:gliding motility-associated-like protein